MDDAEVPLGTPLADVVGVHMLRPEQSATVPARPEGLAPLPAGLVDQQPADLERDGRRELGPADGAKQYRVGDRLVGMGPVEPVAGDADLGIRPLDHDLGRVAVALGPGRKADEPLGAGRVALAEERGEVVGEGRCLISAGGGSGGHQASPALLFSEVS